MMKRGLVLLALSMAIQLAGWATAARVDQVTVTALGIPTSPALEVLHQNVAIKDVTGGQETNPMWTSHVSSTEIEGALEDSSQQVSPPDEADLLISSAATNIHDQQNGAYS